MSKELVWDDSQRPRNQRVNQKITQSAAKPFNVTEPKAMPEGWADDDEFEDDEGENNE